MMNNNRRFSRVYFNANANIAVGREKIVVHIIDISLKGALITKPRDWNQGHEHECLLEIKPGGSDLIMHMHADIAHESDDTVGLRFVEIDLESISHLRRLLEFNTGDASLIEREVAALWHSHHQE